MIGLLLGIVCAYTVCKVRNKNLLGAIVLVAVILALMASKIYIV